MGEGAVGRFAFFQYPPPFPAPKIFSKNIMIKNILHRAKSTISQPKSQPAPEPPEEAPEPAPQPVPTPEPETILKATPKTARQLAVDSAKQVGLVEGSPGYSNIKLCRHQPFNHPTYLYAEGVPQAGWHDKIIVSVKDPKSWKPVSEPRFSTLSARWTGMATTDGVLLFESSDICKANRHRRTPR